MTSSRSARRELSNDMFHATKGNFPKKKWKLTRKKGNSLRKVEIETKKGNFPKKKWKRRGEGMCIHISPYIYTQTNAYIYLYTQIIHIYTNIKQLLNEVE